jgi:hypothetical protein
MVEFMKSISWCNTRNKWINKCFILYGGILTVPLMTWILSPPQYLFSFRNYCVNTISNFLGRVKVGLTIFLKLFWPKYILKRCISVICMAGDSERFLPKLVSFGYFLSANHCHLLIACLLCDGYVYMGMFLTGITLIMWALLYLLFKPVYGIFNGPGSFRMSVLKTYAPSLSDISKFTSEMSPSRAANNCLGLWFSCWASAKMLSN